MASNTPITELLPGNRVFIHVDNENLDFDTARAMAKQKAMELHPDSMQLSWYKGDTGESYPNFECGAEDKPAWILFAESRGGNMAIDINDGKYIFIYLALP